jgi:hypothetical protein
MLVYIDRYQIRQLKENVQFGQQQALEIVRIFNKLPLAPIKTAQQVEALISDPEGFISESLPNTDQKLFGVAISKKKAVQMMDIDTTELYQILQGVNRAQLLEFIQVAKGLEVDIKLLDKRINDHTTVAVSPREKQAAEAMKMILEGFNTWIELGHPAERLLRTELNHFIRYEDGQHIINPSTYRKAVNK